MDPLNELRRRSGLDTPVGRSTSSTPPLRLNEEAQTLEINKVDLPAGDAGSTEATVAESLKQLKLDYANYKAQISTRLEAIEATLHALLTGDSAASHQK